MVCSENDFYTVFSKKGNLCTIETQFTSPLDAIASIALGKIAAGAPLDGKTMSELAHFIGVQRTRVPAYRRMASAMVKTSLDQFLRLGFSDVERASKLLENFNKAAGSSSTVTAQDLVESVKSGAITIEPTETAFLGQMVGQCSMIAEIISQFKWCILEAPAGTGFITCDDPLVTVPSPSNKEEDVGMAIPGATTYFPLTRRFCLEMRPAPQGVTRRRTGAHSTRQLNKNIAANSDRFILGPDESQLKQIVDSSGSAETETDRVRVDVPEGDTDSASVRLRAYRRRYFY